MRVAFLVHDLRPSGGVRVILDHVDGLERAGHDVELVLTGDGDAPEGLPVRQLAAARDSAFDWAIATWWETVPFLYEIEATRQAVLLQSFEQRFYRSHEPFHRLEAAAVLALPVDFVVVANWMKEALAELRPDARCVVVRNGIDKQTFSRPPREPRDGPLRVLVEGQPTLWFKGVEEALEAAAAMTEPAEVTLVAIDPPAPDEVAADRVVGGLSADQMAELYARSDVLVKLSRIEGLGLPVVEAAHAGVPCVIRPFGSHAELVDHGRNGLIVGYDDVAGVTQALDLLAADRELLQRLSRGARDAVASWPDQREAGRAFAAALEELDSAPPPAAGGSIPRLLAAIAQARVTARGGAGDADRLLSDATLALAEAQALVHELSASRDECSDMLDTSRSELERIRSTLSYRALRKARALAGRRAR